MSKDSNAAMQVSSNVTIKTIDSNGKVIRINKIHNKATMTMVSGLLQFLSGAFSPVSTNPNINTTAIHTARNYIPVSLKLGTVGVKMSERTTNKPVLLGINKSDFKIPTFDDYQLQQDITQYYTTITGNTIKFDTASITSFDDSNNSMGLLLQAKLPAGRLVGNGKGGTRKYFIDSMYPESAIPSGKGWVYYNNYTDKYEAMFTEVGLVSDTGTLLARVLLDGDIMVADSGEIIFNNDKSYSNPIIQSDTTSLVIEWRIGLISLGPNDEIISTSNTVPEIPTNEQLDILKDYVDGEITIAKVPDTTESIRDYAFYGLDKMVSVILPLELTTIGNNAFDGCTSLTDVYYEGSAEDWENVEGRSQLEGKTMHYKYNYATD